jgi:hypothetical protein
MHSWFRSSAMMALWLILRTAYTLRPYAQTKQDQTKHNSLTSKHILSTRHLYLKLTGTLGVPLFVKTTTT